MQLISHCLHCPITLQDHASSSVITNHFREKSEKFPGNVSALTPTNPRSSAGVLRGKNRREDLDGAPPGWAKAGDYRVQFSGCVLPSGSQHPQASSDFFPFGFFPCCGWHVHRVDHVRPASSRLRTNPSTHFPHGFQVRGIGSILRSLFLSQQRPLDCIAAERGAVVLLSSHACLLQPGSTDDRCADSGAAT